MGATTRVLSALTLLLSTVGSATPATGAAGRYSTGSGARPFLLIENAGQFDPAVRFQARTPGQILWVTDRSLWITQLEQGPSTPTHPTQAGRPAPGPTGSRRGVNLELTFSGHLAGAMLEPSDQGPTRTNYLLGPDPTRWRSGVRTFGMVTWRGLYPGVSVSLRQVGAGPGLEVQVDPGADLSEFHVRVAGAREVRPSHRGSLVAETAIGPVTLPPILHVGRPLQAEVHGRDIVFSAPGSRSAPSPPPPGGPLFGQGLAFSTFLGGSDDDPATAMAVGPDGSTYVAGVTYSTDFPATPGAFDTSFNGGRDAFVSKLDPIGSTLEYSTFLGGTQWDSGLSLAVGPDGSAYIGGTTASEDFPTTPGAFDTTLGFGDGFLTRLTPDGSGLVYSTFLGGSDSSDSVNALALAEDGTVFATGDTCSDDFPTTQGAFDTTYNSCDDAFVSALDPTGSALLYSTYLGGSHDDHGFGIDLGPDGTAYVSGESLSSDFPTTPSAFDPTSNGGQDGFEAHLNADGSGLVYSTYLGGGDDDAGQAIAVDQAGNAYVTGYTSSPDFPTTPGAYDTTINSSILTDAFATKVDPYGRALAYSTFLGGGNSDYGQGVLISDDGTLTLAGRSLSANFPTTPGAYQPVLRGFEDAFVARLNPTGAKLPYSTFLGGGDTDEGYAIASAGPGAVEVAGETFSRDFPTTPGAYDTSWNGRFDAFVSTLQVAKTMHVASIDPGYRPDGLGYDVGARIRVVYANATAVAGAAVTVELDYPDGSSVQLTGRTGSSGTAALGRLVTATGTYTFTVLSVVRPPAAYDPADNVETSDSVTIP